MKNSSRRIDQVVDLVSRLGAARTEVKRLETELEAVLSPEAAPETVPEGKSPDRVKAGKKAARTRAKNKKAQAAAPRKGPKTNYDRLMPVVLKDRTKTWQVKDLVRASGIAQSSVFEVLKRAVREKLLVKTGYGKYKAGPTAQERVLN